ncbi:UbiA family prenyltransferase [Rhodobacteraceae bacterium M382]|nr:UbiA family prenyltransferase [Rhodobacteraceae bacterium M382]
MKNLDTPDRNIPLIVDLDGTLCRSDTLHETIVGMLGHGQQTLFQLPGWLLQGKAAFKEHLAFHRISDAASLPYNADVIEQIQTAKAQGRTILLVSASHQRQVDAVANHLDCFDDAIGTGGTLPLQVAGEGATNLGGGNKARFLIDRFGQGGYDYIGDHKTDLPVWKGARRALAVSPNGGLERAAAAQGIDLEPVGAASTSKLSALFRAMRPHQWAKNALILLPVLTAQDAALVLPAIVAMICFCMAASAAYLINDLIDLAADRAHPRKRMRPLAAGTLPVSYGLAAAAVLLPSAFGIAAAILPGWFALVLVLYMALTFAYSFWLKRKLMIDVIVLAALYTLRIVAGAAATGIVLSPWLLTFSMFLFFSLATIKRQAELEDLAQSGGEKTKGRNLLVVDLPILRAMSISAAQAAVLVFALYAEDDAVRQQYAQPDLLWGVCPILFFWLGRMQFLTARGFMHDDPVVFSMRDRISLISGLLTVVLIVLAAAGVSS